ncbi:unnamed protein product [Peniophora sp. CBMAI 1063]|nr:unnamed protein product [Peniophora sp. CBMAI 1063]
MLVEFFAPWCGHCKALAPHYEEAATELKKKNIKLAKVDCVDQAELCQAHGVQGYPTLKVFRNGTPTDYSGPRKADGIISYMVKQSLPAVTQVNADSLDEFKSADKIVAVAFLPTATDAPAPEFSRAAEKHREDYLFGLSVDPEAAEAAGVTPPAIVLYRAFDDAETTYPYPAASASSEDLSEWIAGLSIPLMDEVNADNYMVYAQSGKPLAYLFIDPTAEGKDELVSSIREIAGEHRGAVNFVYIDAVKFGDHAKALNLAEPKWPAFVIQDIEKQLKYPLSQADDFSADSVKAHAQKFAKGELSPELKSQPVPTEQDEPVYTVVSKSFEDVVYDDEKDVFMEFYAAWCGHCKRLAPIWQQLAEKFEDAPSLIVGKMDAPENDLPPSVPFRVSGFPTLKFKPAGGRAWVDYEGDRSLESLIAFVEEHAVKPLKGSKQNTSTEETHIHEEL